jgi:hypothetical protein
MLCGEKKIFYILYLTSNMRKYIQILSVCNPMYMGEGTWHWWGTKYAWGK